MKKYVAEFIGTFVLVFGGVGAAIIAGPHIGNLGIALAFGLSLLAMVYAIGPISGCHINPAVTVGMLLSRKIELRDAGAYVVAQILGAIVASALLLAVAKGAAAGYDPGTAGFGANGFGNHSPDHYSLASVFIIEVILTFILVITVLGATDSLAPVGFAGIPIGLVLTVIHLVGIPISNTSVNPARSIGPALFVGGWALGQLWLFILAPVLGGGLAALASQLLHASASPLSARVAEQALHSQQTERLDRDKGDRW